jgi:hypothetical protein
MLMRRPTFLDASSYRAGLRLCPPAFRREYSDQMLQDFEDACREAVDAGGMGRLRLQMGLDLIRTLGVQWFRSGWPVIMLLSVLPMLAALTGLAPLVGRANFAIPTDRPDSEAIGLVLIATITVFLVATTIVLTLWATRPRRRIRR